MDKASLFLSVLGWWNFAGSLFMLFFLNESFGKKVLNEWTAFFARPFVLTYWTRLWLFWAAGLNVLFGLFNIMAGHWKFAPLSTFLLWSDLLVYCLFFGLVIWGLQTKNCGKGGYSVLLVFSIWLCWGFYALFSL